MNPMNPINPMKDNSKVIEHGADAGKTEAQLAAEVFDPNITDFEYFQSRLKALGIKKEDAAIIRSDTKRPYFRFWKHWRK